MSSRATRETDDKGPSSRGAESVINHARNRLRYALVTKEQSTLPFDRTYVSTRNPNETLLAIHSATLDYYTQVSSYVDDIKERSQMRVSTGPDADEYVETNLWVQQIYEAQVPEERVIDGDHGRADPVSGYYQQMETEHGQLQTAWDVGGASDMSFETVPITLDSLLPQWQGWTRRYDVKRQLPAAGAQIESRSLRIIIPIAAAWKIRDQLDRCLDKLDLLADIKEMDDRPFEDWGED